ncbi:hypothetical protein GE061_011499 [Apolygus lucorum]|uniref:Armadillo repeat-containing domain-containing protein n=1 Tax=Apolygus lucorum TaxID=248454 RepID=A0A8S9XY07_APOLU|nr:hypothetical protein GE061_011499 [Apolygus lucorum]
MPGLRGREKNTIVGRDLKAGGPRKSKAAGGPRKSKAAGGPRKSKAGGKSIRSTASGKGGSPGRHGEKKVSEVDVPYAPTTLNVSSIDPFFLLLRCHERSLVLKALNSIYKHIKYNFNDVKLMYEKTYMEDVKDLSQITEKAIPDSALRLLALITKDPNSHVFLTSDSNFMKFLYEHVSSKTDLEAKHCSKILSDLTQDVEIVRRMFEDGSGFDMRNLINNLSHHNADVCHNTMIIIGNIFHDLKCAEKFVNQKEFSFVPLFNLLEKEYIEVQKKALTLIEWLGCQKKTNELKNRFIDQKGVDRMFGVLMKFEWRDIHEQALQILRIYLEDNEDRMRTLEKSGVAKFINYIDFIENDDLIAKVLENILDIASTVFGKLELVELGFVPKVTAMLSDGTVEMKLGACNIINEMLKNTDTVRLFTELTPMKELVEIVVDPDHSWELIGAALGVLHNLAKFSSDMAFMLSKQPLRKMLKDWIMTHLIGMPIKYKNVLYDLMSVMVQHSLVRPLMLEFPFVWAFFLGLKDIDPQNHHIQTVSAEALIHIIPQEKYARQFIVAIEGMEIVTRALFHAKDQKLIRMLCNVVRVAAENDENMLISLLKNHVLEW